MNEITQMLQQNAVNFPIFVFILSLLVGSFLNVVIHRLPIMLRAEWEKESCEVLDIEVEKDQPTFNLAKPDSHCPKCETKIKFYENIPVISYLMLKGRCSTCNTKIPKRYIYIELLTAFASTIVAVNFGYSPEALVMVPVTWVFICLVFIDIEEMILPDILTGPLLWTILLVSYWNVFQTPIQTIIGAAVGYLSFWVLNLLFKIKTKEDGIGQGDFKLLAIVTALLGVENIIDVVFYSSMLAAAIHIVINYLSDDKQRKHFAFGPYIAIVGWVMLLVGAN